MISVAFLFLFFSVSFIVLIDLTLGFSIVLCLRLLVPYIVKVGVGSALISFNNALTIVSILSLFLRMLFRRVCVSRRHFMSFFVFFTSNIVLMFFADETPFPVQVAYYLNFLFNSIFNGLVAWFVFDSRAKLQKCVKMLLVAGFVACLYGIATYAMRQNPYIDALQTVFKSELDFSSYYREARGFLSSRISGTLHHPLEWGQSLVLVFIFLLVAGRYHYFPGNYRMLAAVTSVLMAVAIIMCGSRAVWLTFFMFLFVVVWHMPVKRKFAVFGFMLFVVLVVGLSSLQQIVDTFASAVMFWKQSQSESVGIQGSSVTMRLTQFATMFGIVKNKLLWVGLGQGWIKTLSNTNPLAKNMLGFESILFSKIIEQGLLGFAFFALFFYQTRNFAVRQIVRPVEKAYVRSFFLTYFISIVFTGIQGSFNWFYVLSIFFMKMEAFDRKETATHKRKHDTKKNPLLLDERRAHPG